MKAPFQKGDRAECVADYWSTAKNGDIVRVYECYLVGGKWYISFFNPRYYNKLSHYSASGFINLSRKEPLLHQSQETEMPTYRNDVPMLAVRFETESENFDDALSRLGHGRSTVTLQAPTLGQLQSAIRTRLREYPDERWLVVAPIQIAASAAPPVTFNTI